MRTQSPFGGAPDDELGRLLRDELEGPDPSGFLRRLGERLAVLPERDTQWDVLAHWARPPVLVAAALMAFLLGATLLQTWRAHDGPSPSVATVPATMFVAPTAVDRNPVLYAVLEER